MRGPARPPDTVGLHKYVWHTSWQSFRAGGALGGPGRPFGAKKLTLGATPHEWGFAKNTSWDVTGDVVGGVRTQT